MKSAWFTRFFARHAQGRIRRTFGRVLVAGLPELREVTARQPVLVIANHTTWWDPLVAIWLTNFELDVDSYAMMDATNLRRLPFFEKVGAFGVDRADPKSGAAAVRAAARLLARPGRLVWIYPEGEERSPHAALALERGAAAVARVARDAVVVPIATRFVFAAEEAPELWIDVGAPLPAERDLAIAVERQTRAIAAGLERIDRCLAARTLEGFRVVHQRPPSALGKLAERALAWLVRFF